MKKHPANPQRLIDLPPIQDPAQVTVSLLIRSAIAAPSEDTPRVKWRIRSTLRGRTERRSRVLRVVLVGTCIFVVGGVVGAAVQPFLRKTTSAAPTRSLPTSPIASPSARKHAHLQAPSVLPAPTALSLDESRLEVPAEVALVEPAAAAVPQPSKSIGRRSAIARPNVQPRAGAIADEPTPSMPAATPIAPPIAPPPVVTPDEQALIATALAKLHASRNPQAALVTVDEYRARFPNGALAPEAARLRTEALLMLGRKSVVLDELERSASTDALTGDERLVLRGELRAAVGRWQASLTDFQAVVDSRPSCSSESPSDDQRTQERLERALWGRATARSHLGNEAGAIRDLREYLRCFPEGRFSAQATRLLEGAGKP